MKPFSDACEENKQVILDAIAPYFSNASTVLEIGSGTGQHAVFFAEHMPQLDWQTSDVDEYHAGITSWINDADLDNVRSPLPLNVLEDDWPKQHYDAVFSANTTHIMSWQAVHAMFAGIGKVLKQSGVFCLYGPFNEDGHFTAESNARFDNFLRSRDPLSGIRDKSELILLGNQYGLTLINAIQMPVNNQILVWNKD